MEVKFSTEVSKILDMARDEALRTGCRTIGAGHIMLAILRHSDNTAAKALEEMGVDMPSLKEAMDSDLFREESIPFDQSMSIIPGKDARKVLSIAAYETLKDGDDTVTPEHLLRSLSRSGYNALDEFLYGCGIDYDILMEHFSQKEKPLRKTERPSIDMQLMMGALGEQISNLMGAARSNTNYIS